MKLIIHDLPSDDIPPPVSDTDLVIPALKSKAPCMGCYGCWLKTPGKCVLKDRLKDMGKNLSSCDELVVIAKCVYGVFAPDVKNVIDRSISYLLPFFRNINRMQHHVPRYKQRFKLSVFIYNAPALTNDERCLLEHYVKAISINFNAAEYQTIFVNDPAEVCL